MSNENASAGAAPQGSAAGAAGTAATPPPATGGKQDGGAPAKSGGLLTTGAVPGGEGAGDAGKAAGATGQGQPNGSDAAGSGGEFKLTVPEGMTVDKAQLEQFTALAKESGITPDAATKLLAWEQKRQATFEKAAQDAVREQNRKWESEIKADKDFGGEKLPATIQRAHQTLKRFGDDQLFKDIEEMGLDAWPSLFRLAARVGEATGEDNSQAPTAKGGQKGQPSREDMLNKMFPKSASRG